MTRTRLVWGLGLVTWLAVALGVLRLGNLAGYAESCPLDGPWG